MDDVMAAILELVGMKAAVMVEAKVVKMAKMKYSCN